MQQFNVLECVAVRGNIVCIIYIICLYTYVHIYIYIYIYCTSLLMQQFNVLECVAVRGNIVIFCACLLVQGVGML